MASLATVRRCSPAKPRSQDVLRLESRTLVSSHRCPPEEREEVLRTLCLPLSISPPRTERLFSPDDRPRLFTTERIGRTRISPQVGSFQLRTVRPVRVGVWCVDPHRSSIVRRAFPVRERE